MIHFQIEFSSGLSVYRQLSEQLRYYIASEVLRPGDKLPSVRGLSKELGINPATVVKAYNILENEGLIESQPGRGAFVKETKPAESPPAESANEELMLKLQSLAVLAHQMNLPLNELLNLVQTTYEEIKHD